MELFPAQPDLSLQISPPNTKPTSTCRRNEEELDLGFWKRALDSRPKPIDVERFDLSLSNNHRNVSNDSKTTNRFHHLLQTNTSNLIHTLNQNYHNYPHHHHHHHQQQQQQHQQQQGLLSQEIGFLRPIRGIPVYQNPTSFPFSKHPFDNSFACSTTSSNTPTTSPSNHFHSQGFLRSRFVSSRFPGKRSMRAPRMRWTTTLHARFVHAVELLGGHERATPKSVLELMDVKDLTLAHVKSHLQMYRTVKTTDRAAASSGQSDLLENGSSGDTSEDFMFEIPNPRRSEHSVQQGRPNVQDKDYHGLWSNSSREAWLHGKPKDFGANIPSLEIENEGKCLSYDQKVSSSSEVNSSTKKPNLEFTLGRSH